MNGYRRHCRSKILCDRAPIPPRCTLRSRRAECIHSGRLIVKAGSKRPIFRLRFFALICERHAGARVGQQRRHQFRRRGLPLPDRTGQDGALRRLRAGVVHIRPRSAFLSNGLPWAAGSLLRRRSYGSGVNRTVRRAMLINPIERAEHDCAEQQSWHIAQHVADVLRSSERLHAHDHPVNHAGPDRKPDQRPVRRRVGGRAK